MHGDTAIRKQDSLSCLLCCFVFFVSCARFAFPNGSDACFTRPSSAAARGRASQDAAPRDGTAIATSKLRCAKRSAAERRRQQRIKQTPMNPERRGRGGGSPPTPARTTPTPLGPDSIRKANPSRPSRTGALGARGAAFEAGTAPRPALCRATLRPPRLPDSDAAPAAPSRGTEESNFSRHFILQLQRLRLFFRISRSLRLLCCCPSRVAAAPAAPRPAHPEIRCLRRYYSPSEARGGPAGRQAPSSRAAAQHLIRVAARKTARRGGGGAGHSPGGSFSRCRAGILIGRRTPGAGAPLMLADRVSQSEGH